MPSNRSCARAETRPTDSNVILYNDTAAPLCPPPPVSGSVQEIEKSTRVRFRAGTACAAGRVFKARLEARTGRSPSANDPYIVVSRRPSAQTRGILQNGKTR